MPASPERPVYSPHATERAIDALRRQQGVIVMDGSHTGSYYPIEFLEEPLLASWRAAPIRVLLTAARAKALGLGEEDTAIRADALSLHQIKALGDPLSEGPVPSGLAAQSASPSDRLALKLAKYASLLPTLLASDKTPEAVDWPTLPADTLRAYIEHPQLEVVETAQARLPLAQAEDTRIVSFRSRHGSSVHLALIVGTPEKDDAPLVRVHSSCVTGDILGSLRCDCGGQLSLALMQIAQAGSGILLYLHQEGRGIGIINKLRAYALQERGYDTYEANVLLGFEEDERDFHLAAAILKRLGIARLRLLTNNPKKLAALQSAGIAVTERVPLIAAGSAHSHAYLDAKGKKAGHWL